MYNAGQVTLGVPGAISGDSDTAVTGVGGLIGTASPALPVEQQARTVTAGETSNGGQQYIAGWGNTSGAQGFSVGFSANDIYVNEYGNTLTFTTTANISNGSWHQIAVTATATSATAYLDGTSLGTQSFPVSLDTAPGPLQVGAAVWGYSGIAGNLGCELAIFPTVLSAAKIAALHSLTQRHRERHDRSSESVAARGPVSGPRDGVPCRHGPAGPGGRGPAGAAPVAGPLRAASEQATSYSYDADGRLATVTDAVGTVAATHDAVGNVASITRTGRLDRPDGRIGRPGGSAGSRPGAGRPAATLPGPPAGPPADHGGGPRAVRAGQRVPGITGRGLARAGPGRGQDRLAGWPRSSRPPPPS